MRLQREVVALPVYTEASQSGAVVILDESHEANRTVAVLAKSTAE